MSVIVHVCAYIHLRLDTEVIGKSLSSPQLCSIIAEFCASVNIESNLAASYSRARIQNDIYHSTSYVRAKKMNNYTVCYVHNDEVEVGEVICYIKIESHKIIVAVIIPFEQKSSFSFTEDRDLNSYLQQRIVPVESSVGGNTLYINASDIISKCISIKMNEDFFMAKFPNNLSYID